MAEQQDKQAPVKPVTDPPVVNPVPPDADIKNAKRKAFKVKDRVVHDGELYHPGKTVQLTVEEFTQLKQHGAIEGEF